VQKTRLRLFPPACTRRRALAVLGATLLPAMSPKHAQAACQALESDGVSPPAPNGRILRVRPNDPLLSLAATARAARDGDTIEVEPGTYAGDVTAWPQSDLTIRGVGKRPALVADGKSAEGKAIFVIKGARVRIENLEFRGARVRDRNGAGIRLEGGPLSVHACAFIDNENGLLTGNVPTMALAVTDSSFVDNGDGQGYAHNLYIGAIASLAVEGCWFGRTRVGHLLKSRAQRNAIRYCRLTGEDGTSSYEIDLPSGGEAMVLGNLIQQGAASENQTLVSYGAEGYKWPRNSLTLAFNTLVNDRTRGGVFVRVARGADSTTLANNLLVGTASMAIDGPLTSRGNREAARKEFADPATFDYRLRSGAPLVGQAGFRGSQPEDLPLPQREYVHEASSCPLEGLSALTPLSPGAFQRLARPK
jgi:hypothetical protein